MKIKFCLILLFIIFTTGCTSRPVELNNIGIVEAIAIDKDSDTNNIIFTTQTIRPSALSKESSNIRESTVEVTTTKGKTIFEAIQNITQVLDRKPFLAHTKVIIISEGLAKEGLMPFLDYFSRQRELRMYTWLCIAKNTQAKELLNVKRGINIIQATYLEDIIENDKYHAKAISSSVMDYYRNLLKYGIDPTLGVLQLVESNEGDIKKRVKFSEIAVFKKDKLIGYLNEKETFGFNWVIGKIQNGAIISPSLLDKEHLISLEIKKIKSRIKPEIKNEKISFNIKVDVKVTLIEEQSTAGIVEPKEMLDYLREVKEKVQKEIEEEIKLVVDKSQHELKSDIFGFGSILNRKHPKEWKKVKEDWNDIFPTVNYTTNVNVEIIGTNLKQGIFEVK